MKKRSGIYKIQHISGKIYIGSAIDIPVRWNGHKRALRLNIHHSLRLQRAWNKYGARQFKFEIIEIIKNPTKKKLESREQYWIDFYDASNRIKGYNICPKAGTPLGSKWSSEARERKRKFWRSKKAKRLKKQLSKRSKSKKQEK